MTWCGEKYKREPTMGKNLVKWGNDSLGGKSERRDQGQRFIRRYARVEKKKGQL